MSPKVRRAAHEALDLFLDALAAEEYLSVAPPRKKTPVVKIVSDPQVDETSRKRAEAALRKRGFRLSGA